MITEQELERAQELKKEIKELKITIAKLEDFKVTESIGSGYMCIDSIKLDVKRYTKDILNKFYIDILTIYKVRLSDLKKEYATIIQSPEEAFRQIIEEADE
jgi:hypothetical protein